MEKAYEQLWARFNEECDLIAQECEEEGYPSHGANYDLRVEQLYKRFYAAAFATLELLEEMK